MAMTTPTAPTTEQIKIRTIASLERAAAELKAIDLRSLKGESRDCVKAARAWTADAIVAIKQSGK